MKSDSNQSDFYTSAELAKLFGISKQIISKWTIQGKLPCVRLNSRVIRYPKSAIQKFIDERTSKGS
jgi:excisionase family DNA binding protein